MNALIENTLTDLLVIFARSMAAEGKPNRDAMLAKLQHLWYESKDHRDRCILMLIKDRK